MKNHIKTLCAVAILAAANQAAAESFQLGVTGNLAPTACTPLIDNNGTVDYGAIKSDSLSKDEYNILPEKNINLNISCDAPTKVALRAISERKGSALVSNTEGGSGAGTPLISLGKSSVGAVGFGMDGENKIGAYSILFDNLIHDGVESNGIWSGDQVSWSGTSSLFNMYGYNRYVTIRDGSLNAPVAFTNATFPLIIKGYINKASELDISKPIKLDGLTNIEMVYL
ncbi:DUF1120 domain-containing protein [Pantoea dispersa]|uniref:DUF1120 domain-containing protein n=1 Tax=Pantoea dispersa TaxID=59814 RepID=UPI0024B79770|nr:DUF1120 domain-containing protein [Pantoea dispersa]MDI9766366.1 DUF1120 domain-containing protein [Pantoea dispersa]